MKRHTKIIACITALFFIHLYTADQKRVYDKHTLVAELAVVNHYHKVPNTLHWPPTIQTMSDLHKLLEQYFPRVLCALITDYYLSTIPAQELILTPSTMYCILPGGLQLITGNMCGSISYVHIPIQDRSAVSKSALIEKYATGSNAYIEHMDICSTGERLVFSKKADNNVGDNAIGLWSVVDKKPEPFASQPRPGALKFLPDNKHIVTASKKSSDLHLLDLNGNSIKTFSGHTNHVTSIAVSPDSLLTGSKDKTAKLWDIKTAQVLRNFPNNKAPVASVALSHDGLLGALAHSTTTKLYDIRSNTMVHTYQESAPIEQIVLTPFRFIVNPIEKKHPWYAASLVTYDIRNNHQKYDTIPLGNLGVSRSPHIAFDPSSNTLACAMFRDGRYYLWKQ